MQEVPLGNHLQGGTAEAHCKTPHRQYEMVVKYQNYGSSITCTLSELQLNSGEKKGMNTERLQGLCKMNFV